MTGRPDDPVFLTVSQVEGLHGRSVAAHGGLNGTRDRRLLESAVSTPKQTFDGKYLHVDLIQMAAAYLFHIVRDHPFLDGNKRTGVLAAIVFLDINGMILQAPTDEFEELVLGIASSSKTKRQAEEFIRKYARTSE